MVRTGAMLFVWLGVALCLITLPASAQQLPSSPTAQQLDRVEVIAPRHLHEDAAQIDEKSLEIGGRIADGFEVLQRLRPEIGLFDVNASQSFIAMRGAVSLDESVSADPSVAVWIDDFYIGRGPASRIPFFDVQRIAVHAGPQGDRFGRSAIGGAVSVHSNGPSAPSFVQIEAHDPTGGAFEARISHALTSDTDISMATRISRLGSLSENTDMHALEARRDRAFSIKLERLDEPVYHWVAATRQVRDADAPARFLVFNRPPASIASGVNSDDEYRAALSDMPRTRIAVDRVIYKIGHPGVAGWQGVIGIQNANARVYNNDFAPGAGSQPRILARETIDKERSGSAELRAWWTWAEWEMLIAGYLRKSDAFRSEDFLLDPAPGSRAAIIFGDQPKNNVVSQAVDNTEVSLVISAYQSWGENWSTRLAMRGTYDKKRGRTAIVGDRNTFLLRSKPFSVSWQDDWTFLSPSAEVRWLGAHNEARLEWRRGFKPGGFTNSVNNPASAVTPFGPERADALEFHWGFAFERVPLRISSTLYRTDYVDLQTLIVRSDAQHGLIQEVVNAGSARNIGMELLADGGTERTRFSVSATLQRARYKDFKTASSTGGALDFSGRRVPLTPAHAFRLSADHAFKRGDALRWSIGGMVSYHSELSFFPDDSQSALIRGQTDMTDVTVWLEARRSRWRWRLQSNNLLDERPFVFANNASSSFYFSGAELASGAQVVYGNRMSGRTVELSLRWNFE